MRKLILLIIQNDILPLHFKYTEEEIISKLKERDQKCFADIYDHYSGAVYGIIYRMIQNTVLAEKVLSETFIEAWNNIENYDRSKERTFTWITKIARRRAMQRRKIFRATLKSTQSNQPTGEKIISNDTPFLAVQQECSLTNDQKQIINLAYFESFTVKEISKRLLIPQGTVKRNLRMGILELRKLQRADRFPPPEM